MKSRSDFNASEDAALASVYTEIRVPSDQLTVSATERRRFVARYREVTADARHSEQEIAARLVTLRKNRKLAKLTAAA